MLSIRSMAFLLIDIPPLCARRSARPRPQSLREVLRRGLRPRELLDLVRGSVVVELRSCLAEEKP